MSVLLRESYRITLYMHLRLVQNWRFVWEGLQYRFPKLEQTFFTGMGKFDCRAGGDAFFCLCFFPHRAKHAVSKGCPPLSSCAPWVSGASFRRRRSIHKDHTQKVHLRQRRGIHSFRVRLPVKKVIPISHSWTILAHIVWNMCPSTMSYAFVTPGFEPSASDMGPAGAETLFCTSN